MYVSLPLGETDGGSFLFRAEGRVPDSGRGEIPRKKKEHSFKVLLFPTMGKAPSSELH